MQTCQSNHPPIEHDEFYCPLCEALDGLNTLENEHLDCEVKLEGLSAFIDELSLADVLHLQAQLDRAEADSYKAERQLSALRHTIRHTRPTPMGRYINTVQTAERKVS